MHEMIFVCVCMCAIIMLSSQSCPTLCDLKDCSPPGSSFQGNFQARILKCVAISFSWGSFGHRDETCVSCVSCTGRQIFFFHHCAIWETSGNDKGQNLGTISIYYIDIIYCRSKSHYCLLLCLIYRQISPLSFPNFSFFFLRLDAQYLKFPFILGALEKPICRSGSNSYNWTWNNRLVPNRKRSTSRLYTVTLLI